jgi:three-Cys-motif partner protein
LLVFIEKDVSNFNNLSSILETKKEAIDENKIVIRWLNNDFNSVATKIFHDLDETGDMIAPSLFFVDPFGYKGVPFDTIERVLSYPRTEIFFNFMVSSIMRFLSHQPISKTLTSLFGTDEWREILERDKRYREKALVELYRKQLHERARVKYSLAFRMSESRRSRTLYYLIHAANSIKGHNVMKDIMYRGGSEGFFAYLGPNDLASHSQTTLFDLHNINELRHLLMERYDGKTLAYDRLLKDICFPWYKEPPYIDKQYRQALKELEREGHCSVERITSKISGLGGNDLITFTSQVKR